MKKLLSVLLAISIIFFQTATVFSLNVPIKIAEDNENGTFVTYQDDADGNIILKEYHNGEYVKKVQIYKGSPYNLYITDYTVANNEVYTIDTRQVCLANQQITNNNNNTRAASSTYMGRITYDATGGTRRISVSYSSAFYSSSSYTLNGNVGSLATLTGLILSVLALPGAIGGAVVNWLIAGAGVVVSGSNYIFPQTSLGCEETRYTFELTDVDYTGHTNSFTSSKYYITDQRPEYSQYRNTTFWNGFNPATCWRNTDFGNTVFYHMFTDTYFRIISWT